MEKINSDKEKVFKFLVLLYLAISPLFDFIFLYNRVTTFIRILILAIFVVITLVMYEKSHKWFVFLLAFYLAMLGYLGLSWFHAIGFTSNLPELNYSLVSEASTLLKLCVPFTMLFILKFQNITRKEFLRVINVWVVMIAGSIVLTNLIGYSLSSYTDEITRTSIFSWGGDLTVNETATKGFFAYANQVSNVLLLLLVLAFYEAFSKKDRNVGIAFSVLIMFAMLMLGTRLSTYGGLLVLGGMTILYIGYSVLRKKKVSKTVVVPIALIVVWGLMTSIAPCNSRLSEIESAKSGETEINESIVCEECLEESEGPTYNEDKMLLYIENGINRASIGKQFYMDFYPYIYDMEFWERIVELQRDGVYIDYRKMEVMIAERLWEVDARWSNFFLGISNSRMQTVTNIERDFVLHYYSLGVIGSLLGLSFYVVMYVILSKRLIKRFDFWNICIFACLCLFMLGSFMTGNSLNFLATSVPCAFIVSCGRKYTDCEN